MSLLPIVARELLLAARRKSTFRIRSWTAVIAMIGGFVGLLSCVVAGGPGRLASGWLFSLLTGYAFLLCLLAGILLTADCLSQEKREGTLGFLFLTDLKGYDVVLGKLMATSLNALYGLLALLPILALPLLLGGVTGADYWRTVLALVNTLFFSLTAGLCVSAFSRAAERALRGAFALVLLIAVGLPVLAANLPALGLSRAWSSVGWLSPWSAFVSARQPFAGSISTLYWQSLLTSHALGWSFLALASFALPRLWQERSTPLWLPFSRPRSDTHLASPKRAKLRAERLPRNPIFWLLGDDPALRGTIWLIVLAWAATMIVLSQIAPGETKPLLMASKMVGFLLKVLVAFQACRFFVEARSSGTLEMLLCTPLRNHDLLLGQWLAMKRLPFWPLLLAVLLGFFPFAMQAVADLSAPQPGTTGMALARLLGAVLGVGWCTLGLVADIVTVTWVGMWLGLSSPKPGAASLRTIFYVLVLPSIAVCGLDLLVDLFLILWSCTRLQQDFRWVLSRQSVSAPLRT